MLCHIWSLVILAGSLSATSIFKYPQEQDLLEPLAPQCPEDYDETKPWYEDPFDCNCYYVCDMYGGMVRMCCPSGLWFDKETMNCHYVMSFKKEKQAKCFGNLQGEGSTRQLREIFMGRCLDYQLFKNPKSFENGPVDCDALYESFVKVFFNKAACGEVSMEDYDEFFTNAQQIIGPDMHLFWSGTFAMAQDFSNNGQGHRLYTLEETLVGYLLNNLKWCGTPSEPGINYESCPPFASCDGDAMGSFWARASEMFARQASGIATVMLNGSIPNRPAFRNSSFFSQHELVSLQVPEVHTLRIWVIHDLDKPATETCNFGSVQVLQDLAVSRGLNVICEDNPPEVHAMLCVDKPFFPECAPFSNAQPLEEEEKEQTAFINKSVNPELDENLIVEVEDLLNENISNIGHNETDFVDYQPIDYEQNDYEQNTV